MTELLTDALALLESWGWTSLPFWAKALSGTVAGYVAFRVASDVCRAVWRLARWTGAPAAAKAWWRKPPAWKSEMEELRQAVVELSRHLPGSTWTASTALNVPPRRAG